MARMIQLPNGNYVEPLSVKLVRAYECKNNEHMVEVFMVGVRDPDIFSCGTKGEAIHVRDKIIEQVNAEWTRFMDERKKRMMLKQEELDMERKKENRFL